MLDLSGTVAQPAERTRMGSINRRQVERHACPPKFVTLTWLSEGKTKTTRGYLADLSMGGVQAMLEDAPEKGRLCRMKLHLTSIGGLDLGQIEAGVRVAKREAVETGFWMIGFAFESLVPVAEKTLRLAVQSIRAAVGNGAED